MAHYLHTLTGSYLYWKIEALWLAVLRSPGPSNRCRSRQLAEERYLYAVSIVEAIK